MTHISSSLSDDSGRHLRQLEQAGGRRESSFDGRRLVWRIWGKGPPIVLLHGGSGSWRHWTRNIPVLARNYRVMSADLPGFGDSDEPPEPPSLSWLGASVRAGIDEILGESLPYHLLVFSFGGQVASQFIVAHAPRLMSFNVVAPGGLAPRPVPPLMKVRDKVGDERRAAHRYNLNSLMIADAANIDALALQIQEENTARARLKLAGIRGTRSLVDALEQVQLPTNAFWGECDQFARGNASERAGLLRSLQRDIEINMIAGAGHWAAYERADIFNPLLIDLLQRRTDQYGRRKDGHSLRIY